MEFLEKVEQWAGDGRNGKMRDGKIRLPCGRNGTKGAMGLGDACRFSREILRVLCGFLEHQRRVQFEGCVAEPTVMAVLHLSKWSCLLLRIVLQDALSEVTKVYPPLTFSWTRSQLSWKGENKELAGVAEKVLKSTKKGRGERVDVVDHRRRE